MPSVRLSDEALACLARLAVTHELPVDTAVRVARSLEPLARFPNMGRGLGGRYDGLRFVRGPWRWMLLLYEFAENEDVVVVDSIQDARTATAPRPAD